MLSQSRDVNYKLKMNVAFDTGSLLHAGIHTRFQAMFFCGLNIGWLARKI